MIDKPRCSLVSGVKQQIQTIYLVLLYFSRLRSRPGFSTPVFSTPVYLTRAEGRQCPESGFFSLIRCTPLSAVGVIYFNFRVHDVIHIQRCYSTYTAYNFHNFGKKIRGGVSVIKEKLAFQCQVQFDLHFFQYI